MSDHDRCPRCDQIIWIRADERKAVLLDLRAKVEGLSKSDMGCSESPCMDCVKRAVLALLARRPPARGRTL